MSRGIDGSSGGWVALVGAGPGDPELLTRRAVKRLEQADLVLYDALIDPDILSLAGSAQRIYVGKRAGRPAMRQETINGLLVRAARRGRRVVRLKGGDPFVFGRGGEEALALVAAGIPFEVVPGVSSAVAAAGLAGIPVTHRGVSTAFVVISGHAPSAYEPVLGSMLPHTATVVVLMGLASAEHLTGTLLARGWKPGTPAAVIRGASTEGAERWIGTLAELPAAAAASDSDRPGTIVIGDVVRIGAMLMEFARSAEDDDDAGLAAAR